MTLGPEGSEAREVDGRRRDDEKGARLVGQSGLFRCDSDNFAFILISDKEYQQINAKWGDLRFSVTKNLHSNGDFPVDKETESFVCCGYTQVSISLIYNGSFKHLDSLLQLSFPLSLSLSPIRSKVVIVRQRVS